MHLDSRKMIKSPAETFMIGLKSLIDQILGEEKVFAIKSEGNVSVPRVAQIISLRAEEEER